MRLVEMVTEAGGDEWRRTKGGNEESEERG